MRLPTWLVAVASIVVLGLAGWLFASGGDGDDGGGPPTAVPSTSERDADDGPDPVISVPDDDDPTEDEDDGRGDDAARRTEDGRERLDPDRADEVTGDDRTEDEDEDEDEAADPALTAVAGRTITLAPASGSAEGGARATQVRIGALRVACAGPGDAGRLAVERAVLDRVERQLAAARATVVRIDDSAGAVPCVDIRVRRQEAGDIALVVRASADGPTRMFAARSDAGGAEAPSAAAQGAAAALARAVAGARAALPRTAAERARLAEVGAIDRRGGASVVLAELGGLGRDANPAQLDAVASELARGIATASGATAPRQDR